MQKVGEFLLEFQRSTVRVIENNYAYLDISNKCIRTFQFGNSSERCSVFQFANLLRIRNNHVSKKADTTKKASNGTTPETTPLWRTKIASGVPFVLKLYARIDISTLANREVEWKLRLFWLMCALAHLLVMDPVESSACGVLRIPSGSWGFFVRVRIGVRNVASAVDRAGNRNSVAEPVGVAVIRSSLAVVSLGERMHSVHSDERAQKVSVADRSSRWYRQSRLLRRYHDRGCWS